MRHVLHFLIAALCAVTVACKSITPIRLEPTIEDAGALPSAIRISDPKSTPQLLRGFYELQAGAWRWAEPHFAVDLGTPAGAATRGARLVLDFNLPEPSIAALKTVTVAAQAGSLPLPPQTYTTAGLHQYQPEVPAEAFVKDEITIGFSVDKFLTPPDDGRNLALVVTAISLESK